MTLDRLLTQIMDIYGILTILLWVPFVNVCKEALLKVAPLKQKYIRANKGPFMNKDRIKAIMKRTSLRINYLKK